MLLKILIEDYEKYQLETDRITFQVNSSLMVASSAILAVSTIIGEDLLIRDSTSCFYNTLNVLTMSTNALCILLLGISLFGYVVRVKSIRNHLQEKIQYTITHPGEECEEALKIRFLRFYDIIEKAAYISFVFYILCLTAVGFLK